MTMTYQAIARIVLDYPYGVLSSQRTAGKVTKITETLKLITVNLKMAPEQHIHQETLSDEIKSIPFDRPST